MTGRVPQKDDTMTHLQTAIDHLSATSHAFGYAYFDDASRTFFISPEADMIRLGEMLEAGTPDAYSLWCAETHHEEVAG